MVVVEHEFCLGCAIIGVKDRGSGGGGGGGGASPAPCLD